MCFGYLKFEWSFYVIFISNSERVKTNRFLFEPEFTVIIRFRYIGFSRFFVGDGNFNLTVLSLGFFVVARLAIS